MMDKRVTISILMPMRNAEAYIVETIQSLLDQTFSDFELIIIDDGSSDASLSMVKSFIDGRIRILKGNMQGISAALNRGLKSAQGKFVCRCDSDDIYPKERLQSQNSDARLSVRSHPEHLGDLELLRKRFFCLLRQSAWVRIMAISIHF